MSELVEDVSIMQLVSRRIADELSLTVSFSLELCTKCYQTTDILQDFKLKGQCLNEAQYLTNCSFKLVCLLK